MASLLLRLFMHSKNRFVFVLLFSECIELINSLIIVELLFEEWAWNWIIMILLVASTIFEKNFKKYPIHFYLTENLKSCDFVAQKVGLEKIDKYEKCRKSYQIFYLDTYPKKVMKNSWPAELILFKKCLIFWANKKVRSWRTFDKNSANIKSKANFGN